ncbi:MAG TPA: SIS domain-containing protein [Alphaproteobacteria bacterium]|nr:SIS domain-containing protein [Alphaproteobacteria bacterium]
MTNASLDLVATIRGCMCSLSGAQRRVAEVVLSDPEWAVRANVATLAERAAVSAPTIVRFSRSLGCQGLRDFKLRLAQALVGGTPYLHRSVNPHDSTAGIVHKLLHGAAAALTELERHLDVTAVEAAIDTLAKARRVDCYGVGATSTFLANDAQARFFRLGLVSNAYFDAHLQLISAATLGKEDAVLAISYVGRMPFLLEAVEVAREQKATVIGLTQPATPLARLCDIPLTFRVPEDEALRVGTEAYLAQLALLEILTVGVGIRRGPPAIAMLKRFHDVLRERGVDSEAHPVLKQVWSKMKASPAEGR